MAARPDLRGPSGGVWSPLEALRGRARPADTSRHPKSSLEALRGRAGTPRVLGGAPGGNRETVFLSSPIRGQPRSGVSVTSRSPFSVMGDRPSSVGGEERSLSVGGDLGKKCNMLIYPSRYRGGDPRGCVLELIGFPVSQSGGPQGSFRASRHLQAPQMESGGPQGSNRVCRPSGVSRCLEALLDP